MTTADQNNDAAPSTPPSPQWRAFLATLSPQVVRQLALEVWVARRHMSDPQLRTWLGLLPYALPARPGFRPGHFGRLHENFIAKPLADLCLHHDIHAAHLVACWMFQQDHTMAALLTWCNDAGMYYVKPSWVEVDDIAKGFVDLTQEGVIARWLGETDAPASERWRHEIVGRWVNSYFSQQDATLVENATRVAVKLAGVQTTTANQDVFAESCSEEQTPPTQTQRRTIAPEKRGGRPRGSSNGTADSRDGEIEEATFSIAARKAGLSWRVYLESSCEDETVTEGWLVRQGNQTLPPDVRTPYQWLLPRLEEDVEVNLEDGVKSIPLRWLKQGLLVFRLSQRDVGRMVSAPSRGTYLLLAPQDWTPAMHCYRAKEECDISGYAAYFVNLSEDVNRIAFDTPTTQVIANSSVSRFWCAGACAEDATLERPPIYLDAPPKLAAFTADDWNDITRVVVVEEGSQVDSRRRFFFDPVVGSVEQDLSCLDNVVGGWFSARLYGGDEFIDSITFRFARGLKSLAVEIGGALPKDGQQVAARVMAAHTKELRIHAPHAVVANGILVDETHLVADLPARADADAGDWRIALVDGWEMPITLRANRVWWAFSPKPPEEDEWGCVVPMLCRQDFRASSKTTLWIKAACHMTVQVGFSAGSMLPLVVNSETGLAQIRLGSLTTDAAVMDRTVDANLILQIGDQSTLLACMPAEDMAVAPAVCEAEVDGAESATAADVVSRLAPPNNDREHAVEDKTAVARDEKPDTTKRIITQQFVDYSYIHPMAEDPAYRWFAISCPGCREDKLIAQLKAQIHGKGISDAVPVIVFPHWQETSTTGRRTSTKPIPLIEHGYVFVLMKPDTDLQHYLNNHGALLLTEPLPAEWLEKIIDFKAQAPADAPSRTISAGQMVLIVDGALKGQMGLVKSFDSAKENARIEVGFVHRTVLVSIPVRQITPA